MVRFKRNRRKARLVKSAVLAAIAIIVIIIVSLFNHPLSSQVKVGNVKAIPPAYSIDLTPTPIAGKYVSFNYPKGMHKSIFSNTASMDNFNFVVRDASSWVLAVDVNDLPPGGLKYDSGYALRLSKPDEYQFSNMTFQGQLVPVATDTAAASGFAKVAYVVHGQLMATVALSGADPAGTGPLDTTFAMVLSSLHWLK